MPLLARVFRCPRCGLEIDRDLNAALNLMRYGLTTLKGTPFPLGPYPLSRATRIFPSYRARSASAVQISVVSLILWVEHGGADGPGRDEAGLYPKLLPRPPLACFKSSWVTS
uniref:Cas12f1-like TNB domain-containing protein n=1 Tax=Thermus caliditerrae TaxID=1330700 RepID=A0A7C5RFC9_9DEIN